MRNEGRRIGRAGRKEGRKITKSASCWSTNHFHTFTVVLLQCPLFTTAQQDAILCLPSKQKEKRKQNMKMKQRTTRQKLTLIVEAGRLTPPLVFR